MLHIDHLLGIFGFLVVLLRAAILGFQTVATGGIIFLLLAARSEESRTPELLRSSWRVIRWSALGLALSQLFFVVTNSLVLMSSANLSLRDVIGANFVIAGVFAIFAGIMIFLWPATLQNSVNPLVLVPAAFMIGASVLTSHAASRMEDRALLVSFTSLHYLATASWIGGLPFLLLAMKRVAEGPARAKIARNFSRMAAAWKARATL